MSAPMSRPAEKIFGMVATVRSRWRRRQLIVFATLGAATLIGWLFAMIVLDNLAMLTSGQLVLGWIVLLMALLGWAGATLYRWMISALTATDFALLYEARVAGRRNRLVNAVQFLESQAAQRDSLACAAVYENAAALDARTAPQAVDAGPARRALLFLALCILLLLAYAVLRPTWAANALARLLHPLSPTAHLLATEPSVTPGNVELIEGAPLTIAAQVPPAHAGQSGTAAVLQYSVADLAWTQVSMKRVSAAATPSAASTASQFVCEFDAVRQPLRYRVCVGRSASPTYRVTLRYRPRIERLEVSVRRPEYAGGQTHPLKPSVGDVAALQGSTIALNLTASVPLSAARLELSDGSQVPLDLPRAEPRQASGGFVLRRSGTYALVLTDSTGLTNDPPPRYTLSAEPDQPPLAAVTVPGRDLIVPADAELELTVETEDDFGLARAALQVRRGGGEWKTAAEWGIPGRAARRHSKSVPLALTTLGLQTDDVLQYRAVAWDHHPPQPNMGVGRTWSLTIAEPNHEPGLLTAETRRLLEALSRILSLQKQNRTDLDLDRPEPPLRARQAQIRDLTFETVAQQRKALRPVESIIAALEQLTDGPMLQAVQQLADYGGTYQQRLPHKRPLLDLMDAIVARLEELIGKVSKALASAEQAQAALEQLAPPEREQALEHIRDLLEKLRNFVPQQDVVVANTEELARKGADLTDADLQKIEQLKGTEDRWAEVFTDSVKDISKLTEQGFADRTIANDYKEMVEQIEAASLNLTPQLIELAVPREQSGRELAESLVEEMEMWLPNSPDHVKWMMEEPPDFPEIPMVDLPDQLWDLIGELVEQQDELNEAAEDMTSAWADSIAKGAGWEVAGGPISNFSALGKTGNQLPDNNELSGRAGEGRSGRSQGQLVENVAKGLGGRQTPTRITNDPYEQGVVRELQQMATGGATGGGKARGAGQEGLQGQSPPPLFQDMQLMADWQKRIRQQTEQVAGQLQAIRISLPQIERSIALMKQAEQAAADGRYAELFKLQQMVLQQLKLTGQSALREAALRVDRAWPQPADQRRQVFDALDEPVPPEYQDAVRRYFEQLSEGN